MIGFASKNTSRIRKSIEFLHSLSEMTKNKEIFVNDDGSSPFNPPVYSKLKYLHLITNLVGNGQPTVTIVVACEDGVLHVLDRHENLISNALLTGKPLCLESCPQEMVIGTDSGTLEIIEIN